MVVDAAPDPLAGAEEVAAVDLGEVVDAVGGGDREVDRLAAGLGHRLERGLGQLDEMALQAAAMGEAQDRRAGLELAALAGLVDEAVALERRDEPRGGALGQVGGLGEVAQAHRLVALEQAREHLAGTVDRLGALTARTRVTWKSCSTSGWNCSSIADSMAPAGSPCQATRVRCRCVRQHDAPLRDPQRGRHGGARPRLAADRHRDRDRVPARRGGRGLPRRRPAGRRRER